MDNMAKKKAQKVEGAFGITLRVNGEKHESSGATIDEALKGLPPLKAKTRAHIFVTCEGRVSKPIPLSVQQFARLFFPGMTGEASRTAFKKKYAFYA